MSIHFRGYLKKIVAIFAVEIPPVQLIMSKNFYEKMQAFVITSI